MDEGHRAEMKPPAAGPAEGAAAEAALTELREVNDARRFRTNLVQILVGDET